MHLTLRGKKVDDFGVSILRISLISILEIRTRVLGSEWVIVELDINFT